MRPQYRVVICDIHGSGVAELENADVTNITIELNTEGALEFTLPTTDPKSGLLAAIQQEIQVWRNGVLLFWGVPIRLRIDRNTISVQCAGLLWYFKKRLVGRTNRVNFLGNPSFESALFAVNSFPIGNWSAWGVAAALVTDVAFLGGNSLRLTQANPGVDTYVLQHIPVVAGNRYFATAWLYIHSDYPWTGAAANNRGLFLRLTDIAGNVIDEQNMPIDASFQPGMTYRMETSIAVPTDRTDLFIQMRLYAPGGMVNWDAASLTIMESLSRGLADQAAYASDLVLHAQGLDGSGNPIPAPSAVYPGAFDTSYPARLGKTDLNIRTNCPPSGVNITRSYQYADHQIVGDLIKEFTQTDSGLDIDIVFPSGQPRMFTTYFPRKGQQTPRTNLTLETGRNIQDFSIDVDGDQTFSSVTVISSDANGPGREEAGAIDTSGTGGTALEGIYNSIPGSPISQLQGVANEQLRRVKYPLPIPQLTTYPDSDLIGVLTTGDVVPVKILYGGINIYDNYRVVRLEINPVDDTMIITLNHL